MTRRLTNASGCSALYEYLRDTFEAKARQLVHRPAVDAHLAVIRAGQPVDIQLADLPPWAREGQPLDYLRRAIVTVTGSVQLYVDDGTRWLEEHGL